MWIYIYIYIYLDSEITFVFLTNSAKRYSGVAFNKSVVLPPFPRQEQAHFIPSGMSLQVLMS